MDCKEAEKLIQPYVQGNMPEKEMEPFISHIRKCPYMPRRNWRHILL